MYFLDKSHAYLGYSSSKFQAYLKCIWGIHAIFKLLYCPISTILYLFCKKRWKGIFEEEERARKASKQLINLVLAGLSFSTIVILITSLQNISNILTIFQLRRILIMLLFLYYQYYIVPHSTSEQRKVLRRSGSKYW